MPGKSFNGGLGKNFEDKLMQTIEKKVEQKTQEAFDKASETEYTFEVNNTQVKVTGKQVQEQLSRKLKQAVDGTEVKADVSIKPDAKVDTGAAKEAAKKTVAYLKDAIEGTVKPVEVDINSKPLQERLKYLQDLKKESKFLETAEERRIEMEEKAWDAGGNRPKSEADSQNKIRQYEELVEHIGKANTAVDEFGDKYEKVIIKFKDGSEEIVETVLGLDGISLAAQKIQDIQFFPLESVAEDAKGSSEKVAEYVKKSDDEIYAAARELASKQESIFKEIAEQEIAMANKTSEETRKAYAEMAMASKEMFDKGASDFDVEEKINKTQVLIDELTAKLADEKDPAVISSLNEQLDAAKIKMLALQDAFKNIKIPRNFYSTSDLESDVLERYSRQHRENFVMGINNNFSIPSEEKKYWQTITNGIYTQKQLSDAIKERKEQMIELNNRIDEAEEKERKLYELSSNTTGKEHDDYHDKWLKASEETTAIVEDYNEIRSELYNLIQLQNNWGKSIEEAAEINSTFMGSEWREEEQAMNALDDEILALAEARKADNKAKKEQAQSSEENAEAQNKERQATSENTEAQQEQRAVNEAANEAQDEAQEESRETTQAERQEEESHEENTNALREELDALEKVDKAKKDLISTSHSYAIDSAGNVIDQGRSFSEQTRVGQVLRQRRIPEYDSEGNPVLDKNGNQQYTIAYQKISRYTDIVREAAKATIDLKKAEYDLDVESKKANPNAKNMAEYNVQIQEATKRLDEAKDAASKFHKETEGFINDPKYDTKYFMSMFDSDVADATVRGISKANVQYNNAIESTQQKAQKAIDSVIKKLSEAEIKVDNIQATYDKSVAPGVSKPVSDAQDLNELEQKRAAILTEINRIKGNGTADAQELTNLDKLIAEYKLLAKVKKDANNPTKREMGGQELTVAIEQEIARYDKLIAKSEEYGRNTKDITEALRIQRQELEQNGSVDEYYNSQNIRKFQDAKLDERLVQMTQVDLDDFEKGKAIIAEFDRQEAEYQAKLTEERSKGKQQEEEYYAAIQKTRQEREREYEEIFNTAEQVKVYDDAMALSIQTAKEDAEYAKKRAEYLAEGKRQLEEYNAERAKKTAEYKDIFFNGTGKLNEVEFAPNTEALRNSNALYDELESHVKRIYDLKEANAKLDKNTNVGNADNAKNEAEIAEKTERIKNIILEINAAEAVQEAREEELLKLDRERDGVLKDILNRQELQSRDNMQSQVKGWIEEVEKLQRSKKYTQEFSDKLDEVLYQLKEFDSVTGSIEDVNAAFKKLNDTMDEVDAEKGLSEFKKAQSVSISKLDLQITEFMRKNTRMGRQFREEFENLRLDWDTEHSLAEVQKLADEFAKLKARVTEADKLGAGFFDTLRQRAIGVNAQLIAQYLSWQDIIRYGRQAFEVIHDLDDALVDLKKTTAMSEKELNQFYYSSNKTAKEMGVSTKAIIEQSAAWSRLGYNTAETSEKMAALSSQFASISPGMTTEQAQTGLVSLMKAYKVNVDDVERELMDNINVLGNKFAEDNLDIIEGMERAGATLSALGTSVQDSFALFTGAQEIIQNAETTGTALKTLSLRIRGFDEETEELSDDVIKATGKVADLTKVASNNYAGVSLWADAEQTRYRRLVDYLGDIASIWDEISEKNKTQLLNNLFGKRGASVGSAILQNFDQVKNALTEMENAAGAADAEMEIIKQSISYKLNELKQTWVGILQEMIERGQINDLIDALIKLSENIGKVIEAIGPIPTLIAGFGLKELILNFDKVSDFSLKFIGDLYELGSTAQTAELFLGETADAANAVGVASGKSTNSVVKLGQALVAVAKSPITWIAVAIGAAALAWDAFTDTVKETEEKVEKTKNKISEIEVEIKKLEELGDNRTKAEDVRLQQLRDELSLQERILKIEEKRKYAEVYGNKFSDWFDKDNYNAIYLGETNRQSPDSVYRKADLYNKADSDIKKKMTLLHNYQKELEEIEKIDVSTLEGDQLSQHEEQIESYTLLIGDLTAQIEELNETKLTYKGDLLSKAEDYRTIIESTQKLIDDGVLKGSIKKDAENVIADFTKLLNFIEDMNLKEYGLDDKLANNISHIVGRNKEDKEKLEEYTKNFTTAEIKAWLEATEGAQSADEAIQRYEKSVKRTTDAVGEVAEEAKKISYAKLISDLEELGSNLDNVGTMMANVDEHGQFEIGDLDKIADYFAALEKAENGVEYETEEVNKALKLLGEGTGTIQENADAINTLADNYLRTSGVLKNLNEENKNLYIGRLKNMGIINAEAVVESELANAVENETQAKIVSVIQDDLLVQYKQALADGNYEEANSIIAKIDALLKEQNANENTEKSVAFLVKAQEIFNNQDLDVNEKIKALEKLSESYLNTAEKAKYAAQMASLQAQSDQLEKDYAAGNGHGMDWRTYQNNKARIEADMEKLTNEAAKNTAKVNYTKVQYNGGTKVKDKTGKNAASTVEALNNAMKKAADDAANKAKESFKETIDYFERLIKVLDNSISMLEAHLEDVSGAFAKNTLLGAEEDLVQSKINSYSSAIDMYAKKAQQELAKIPADIAAKLQSGAVDLDDFIGEENRELVEAIKNYQTWADKVDEARLQLVQLKETLRQLELKKFNNIIKDFTDSINFRQTSGIDLIQKQMDLLSEAGQLIGESFYARSIEQEKRILESLQNEQAALVKQLNEALNKGVEVGSDEWIEMANALTEVESKILDSKKAIEEFDNALLNLHTEVFEKIQNQFSSYIDELSNMKELIDDESKPVATADNKWTKEGLAQLGLLAQQYELSKYQVEQYNQEIELLNQQYLEGRYSTMEYMEKLQDLKSKQWEAVNASEAAKDAMRELNKARIEVVKEGINKEIDAYEKLIQAQKDALQAEKDLHDYRKQVADESKAIVNIERQLAAIADDQSASAIAKRKKLEQELHDARETLEETEYDHSISQQEDALDEQLKNYKETREAEIKTLEESLLNVEQLLEQTFEDIRANSQLIGETIVAQAQAHGIEMSQALTDAWFNGENSIAKYGDVLSSATSNFIGNIQGVESEVWELQNQANATSEGLASMFSTRADNLVQQLEGSWQSEANLNAMTNALHDSLSSTIDGSYAGTAAKTALDGITSSVDELADSAERARQSLLDLLRAKEESDENQSGWIYEEDEDGNLRIVGKGKVKGKGVQNMGGRYYYATGAKRITHDQLAWTQENGPEMIVSPSDGAVLTPLSRGDSVLPTDQTANIWEWSKFNPTEFASKLIQSISGVGAGNVQTNTMQVGSLVTVNGNINDTMEMMQIAATEASAKIKQSFKEINNNLH